MRLTEGLRLRIKDIEFDRRAIVVRTGKGSKGRVLMLLQELLHGLRIQITKARLLCKPTACRYTRRLHAAVVSDKVGTTSEPCNNC